MFLTGEAAEVHREKVGKATCCVRLYLGVQQNCDLCMFGVFSFTLFFGCEKLLEAIQVSYLTSRSVD